MEMCAKYKNMLELIELGEFAEVVVLEFSAFCQMGLSAVLVTIKVFKESRACISRYCSH